MILKVMYIVRMNATCNTVGPAMHKCIKSFKLTLHVTQITENHMPNFVVVRPHGHKLKQVNEFEV